MPASKGYGTLNAQSPLAPYNFSRREPGPTEITVDILYCGVCHSDLHMVRNEWGNAIYPLVPGHEIVGRVTAVGNAVTKFKVGSIAAIGVIVDSCRKCAPSAIAAKRIHLVEGPAAHFTPPRTAWGGLGRKRMGGYSSIGRGVADPASPIAARVWVNGDAPVDGALLEARIARALRVRQQLFGGDAGADGGTTAYRLLHGEGDRTPGFVVHRHEHVAVLRLDGDAARAYADTFIPYLWKRLQRAGVRTLVKREAGGDAKKEGRATHVEGEPMPDVIDVREHGVPFVVDLARGQKTGAFLDQRENRRRVQEIVRVAEGPARPEPVLVRGGVLAPGGPRGGRAGHERRYRGGRARDRAVELQAGGGGPEGARVRDGGRFRVPCRGQAGQADVGRGGRAIRRASRRARRRCQRAIQAYRALHRACADVLADGGVLCAASCSSHVDASDFAATLDDQSLGRSDLRLLSLDGPGEDHPTLPAWPEGRYLKFAVLE